jgi:hypothetical protein
MRNRRLFMCLFLSAALAASAAAAVFDDVPGSYAVYHDTRFGDDCFIGLCYVGSDTIVARSYETRTGNELMVMLPLIVEDGELDLGSTLKILRGALDSSAAARRLIAMCMNWMRSWYLNRDSIDARLDLEYSADDDYVFSFWIPVFRLREIKGDEANRFYLVTAGVLKSNTDERFFSFKGLPEPIDSERFEIKAGKPIEAVIDGLKVPLDDNWKTEDQSVYRIQVKTEQDAAFYVETMDLKKQGVGSPQRLALIMMIGNKDVVLLAEGSRVFKDKGSFNCLMRVLDPASGKATIQQTQLIERGGSVVSIATLAAYETLYIQNKAYFDRIIY